MANTMLVCGTPGRMGSPRIDSIASRYSDLAAKPDSGPKVKEAAMFLEVAEGYLDDVQDPDFTRALKAANQALDIFTEMKHLVGTADANRLIVQATIAKGDKSEAEKLAKSGIVDFKSKGHHRGQAIMTLALAEVGLDRNDSQAIGNEEAAINAKEAADSFHKQGDDPRMEACSYIILAKVEMIRKKPKEAIAAANSAIELARSAGDAVVGAKALHSLGEANILNETVANVKDGIKNGIQAFKNALAIYQELGMNLLHAYALYDTARWTLKCLHKPKSVLEMAHQAFEKFKEIKKTKAALTCLELIVQADIQYDYMPDACKAAFEGVMYFRSVDEKSKEVAKAWILMCEAHIAEHNPATINNGLDAILNSIKIAQELGDKALMMNCLQIRGKAECEGKFYKDAAGHLAEARTLAKELDDARGDAATLRILVDVGMASDNMEDAVQAAEEQREIYQRLGLKREESASLLMAATCLSDKTMDSEKLDRGLMRAIEARNVAKEAKDTKAEGSSLLLTAKLLTLLEREDDAIEAASDCVKLLKNTAQADTALGGAHSYLAKNYMMLDMADEALKNADAALAYAKGSRDPKFEAEAFIMLAEVNYGVAVRQDQEDEKGLQIFHKCVTKSWQSAKLAKARCERFKYKDLLHKALCAMGEVGVIFDPELAAKSAEEAQNLSAELEDDVGVATAVVLQANILYHKGKNPEARSMAERGVRLAEEAELADLMADGQDIIKRCEASSPAASFQPEAVHQQAVVQQAAPGAQSVAVAAAKVGLDLNTVIETVTRVASMSIADDDDLNLDTPLMDAGLDSLSSVAFRNQLISELKMQLPAALMFDYPNVRQIADWIVEKSEE